MQKKCKTGENWGKSCGRGTDKVCLAAGTECKPQMPLFRHRERRSGRATAREHEKGAPRRGDRKETRRNPRIYLDCAERTGRNLLSSARSEVQPCRSGYLCRPLSMKHKSPQLLSPSSGSISAPTAASMVPAKGCGVKAPSAGSQPAH